MVPPGLLSFGFSCSPSPKRPFTSQPHERSRQPQALNEDEVQQDDIIIRISCSCPPVCLLPSPHLILSPDWPCSPRSPGSSTGGGEV